MRYSLGHERIILLKALASSSLKIRKMAMEHIKSTLPNASVRTKEFLVHALVDLLCDPHYPICQHALDILEDAVENDTCLDALNHHIATIAHLDIGLETLILK